MGKTRCTWRSRNCNGLTHIDFDIYQGVPAQVRQTNAFANASLLYKRAAHKPHGGSRRKDADGRRVQKTCLQTKLTLVSTPCYAWRNRFGLFTKYRNRGPNACMSWFHLLVRTCNESQSTKAALVNSSGMHECRNERLLRIRAYAGRHGMNADLLRDLLRIDESDFAFFSIGVTSHLAPSLIT